MPSPSETPIPMSKIQLGARPKNFTVNVEVPMLDGTTGIVPVTYKYRTKKEFGQFVDEMTKDAGQAIAPGSGEAAAEQEFSMERVMSLGIEKNADYLIQALDGWGLDQPFSRDALVQLADEVPAAPLAIMERYREALTQGRLGN